MTDAPQPHIPGMGKESIGQEHATHVNGGASVTSTCELGSAWLVVGRLTLPRCTWSKERTDASAPAIQSMLHRRKYYEDPRSRHGIFGFCIISSSVTGYSSVLDPRARRGRDSNSGRKSNLFGVKIPPVNQCERTARGEEATQPTLWERNQWL